MILSRIKWRTCLVYIDDLIIYSKSFEDHLRHADEILTALEEVGVTLKISKRYFFGREVENLGLSILVILSHLDISK